MTKIIKKETEKNMHSHNEVLDFLDKHLGKVFSKEAQKRLETKGVSISRSMINNIRSGQTTNWAVLEVLAEMAHENKESKGRVAELVNNK